MSAITPADLIALIDRGAAPRILDVRTSAEFAAGHVPGAVNVPFNETWSPSAAMSSMAGRSIVMYCGHGPRAWIASLGLRRHGIRDIVYVRGHWAAWRRAGLRVESN